MTDPRLLLMSVALSLVLVGAGFLLLRLRYQQKLALAALEHSQEVGEWQAAVSRLEERLAGEGQAAADKLELLQGARKQMSDEFNSLANRIFEEKSERLLENSKNTLQHTLSPLQNQLQEFRKRVDHVYDTESRDRVSLLHELNQLKLLNKQMSEDAVNLTRALKGDKKAQGNWGEVVLERVLEESGLRKGYEYETQVSLQSAGGERRMPDVVVRLPEEKDIIIDAKVSLVDYSRYVASDDELEKRAALAGHVQAIKNHIKGLSIKDYDGLEGVRTLDFVLMFIPIESAFMAAFDAEPDMFRTAYDKQVIVVSPTTLLATLRTVQSIWRYEQQNKNAEKIANQAGAIHDQFALVLESLSEVGKHLDKARGSWDKTRDRLNSGRGNLVRRVQQLQELGARTRKTLPPDMTDSDAEDSARLTDSNPDEENLK
ncbi:DNA recombination protein RmuC [Halieaceae bacterium IMCC14734]|uniref:DNA recombination protein RmuC n=2 Tax=Candidatus Litorirhabdus singularis TaxID=2518993 RepID=A0ABT3TFY4_9GAMM|nr:DNA recombination protein RmuC [Candidatus Litorirhabdus singularis]